jgi:hypothetical protein
VTRRKTVQGRSISEEIFKLRLRGSKERSHATFCRKGEEDSKCKGSIALNVFRETRTR